MEVEEQGEIKWRWQQYLSTVRAVGGNNKQHRQPDGLGDRFGKTGGWTRSTAM